MMLEVKEEKFRRGEIVCGCRYPMCCCGAAVKKPDEKCTMCSGGSHLADNGMLIGEWWPV